MCIRDSEGGVGIALAEMCIGGRCGAEVDLDGTGNSTLWARLWGESLGRIIVSIPPHRNKEFLDRMKGMPVTILGQVTGGTNLHIVDGNETIVSASVDEMVTAWQSTLDFSKEAKV